MHIPAGPCPPSAGSRLDSQRLQITQADGQSRLKLVRSTAAVKETMRRSAERWATEISHVVVSNHPRSDDDKKLAGTTLRWAVTRIVISI